MKPTLGAPTVKEAVRRILERNGGPMRPKDIQRWPERTGRAPLTPNQVSGALFSLKKDGAVESAGRGTWRLVAARGSRAATWAATPAEPLDVTGLTSKEQVLRILAHTKRPMKHGHIVKWLEDNGHEALTDGQIAGALYDLATKLKVVEKVDRGTYRIHKEWEGGPLDHEEAVSQPAGSVPPKEPKRRVVIPCYGLHWERNKVSWNAGASLLGALRKAGEDAVNFANQTGVYVLYQWPQVTYVGRTASSGLYQRLRSHDVDASKDWDRFSWFGLGAVDDDGVLHPPSAKANTEDQVTMVETVLIEVLRPPFNNKQGDLIGDQYRQVPDPVVEEREQKVLAERLRKLLQTGMA